MRKPVLVPTDLSANSKAGIRFALQWAAQTENPLLFFHCMPYLKPTRWSDAKYNAYVARESANILKQLERFVARTMTPRMRKNRFTCVVQESPDVEKAIVDYAVKAKAQAICMSTRGAGRLKKIIGTHASAIINRSPVPVLVIPKTYRATAVKHILYASDLNNVGTELKQVKNIASALGADITVCHFDVLEHVDEAKIKLEKVASRYKEPNVHFRFAKFDVDRSLAKHLKSHIRASAASVVALFTDQKRGWFDRLFLASKSEEMAFDAKVPLLVFPKKV